MIALIFLAAGYGRRFSGDKLLYRVDDKPMYRHCLEKLMAIAPKYGCELVAVTRESNLHEHMKALPIRIVLNPDSHLGISTSIRAGLSALSKEVEAAVFFVADQPRISTSTIQRLLEAGQNELSTQNNCGIVCVSSGGTPGNPVLFSKKYFAELMALSGDTGGKAVLRRHMDDVRMIEADSPTELADMDTLPQ